MASFFRIIWLAAFFAVAIMLGYWHYRQGEHERAMAELRTLNQQMQHTLAQRMAMIGRLSRSHRLAHVEVLDQKSDDNDEIASTSIRFIELDDDGSEIARQDIQVPGDVLFIDAWTVKFEPAHVAEGDPLRGRTLVLLRRVYSDRLAPRDGIALDVPGAIPAGYAASDAGRFEQQLWKNFWTLAGDAEAAARMGVRVAQGEAVYKPVRKGQTYELVADAVGGLSLTPLFQTVMSGKG